MRQVVIYGDLLSDRTGEQYPEVSVCDECYAEQKEYERKNEEQVFVLEGGESNDASAACHFCEKTFEEEQEENS